MSPASAAAPRVVSLLASATETLCAIGAEKLLVGRSHECDWPASVHNLPVCSRPKFKISGSSAQLDQRVRDVLSQALSIYEVDVDRLRELAPDVILTQDHCEVCAVSTRDLDAAACALLPSKPRLVILSPHTLADIYRGMHDIGAAVGASEQAERLSAALREGLAHLEALTKSLPPVKVVGLEWIDPPMATGHWMPALIRAAGGRDLLGAEDASSRRLVPGELEAADPDCILAFPCGWDLKKAREEMKALERRTEWPRLRAVREGRVFIFDGNQHFNRPGPRLLHAAEMLAGIFHPGAFPAPGQGVDWDRYTP